MLDDLVEHWTLRVGRTLACRAFGINDRSNRHRRQIVDGRARPVPVREHQPRRPHPARLSDIEKDLIVATLCSPRFCDLAPAQVYATLLDEGVYVCSERQMYRVLSERDLVRERRRGGHGHAGHYNIPRLQASAPNQVWTWDITALRGPTRGVRYYLYTMLDIYSRKTVGWSLHTVESAKHARRLLRETCRRYHIDPDTLTIHSDRGSPMTARSVAELLTDLGVAKSHSRPRVSNDNPFIEAHFKTLKYRPDYPARFNSITEASAWCRNFFTWYNETHYHSAIGYLRPADFHDGQHGLILERRQITLDHAAAAHPERFTHRPHPAHVPEHAWINRPSIQTT